MIIETRQPIDFSTFPSSDGKPMADNETNLDQMIDLVLILKQILTPHGHHAGSNLLMYYNPDSGWDHCSPDVFVALDTSEDRRESWKTWVEGKFPEVVFEIASPSTLNTDIGPKVRLYERLGAREYYIFAPAGRLDPAYRGFVARDGRLVPMPNPTGRSITSPLLGLEFRVVGGWLRVMDPHTGEPYPTPKEEHDLRQEAEERAAREAQARRAAEVEAAQATQARRSAEAEAAELRRMLEEARAEAARLRAQGGREEP